MSLLTLLSLSGLMIIELVRPYLNAQLPLILQESHNLASMAQIRFTVSVVGNIIEAILWGLILLAIFGWR